MIAVAGTRRLPLIILLLPAPCAIYGGIGIGVVALYYLAQAFHRLFNDLFQHIFIATPVLTPPSVVPAVLSAVS